MNSVGLTFHNGSLTTVTGGACLIVRISAVQFGHKGGRSDLLGSRTEPSHRGETPERRKTDEDIVGSSVKSAVSQNLEAIWGAFDVALTTY